MADWGPKDPDAIRDFGIDWTPDIGNATIASSEWLLDGVAWPVDADLEKVSAAFTNTNTTIRLSGGVKGEDYEVTNRVTLSNDEVDDWTETLEVRSR